MVKLCGSAEITSSSVICTLPDALIKKAKCSKSFSTGQESLLCIPGYVAANTSNEYADAATDELALQVLGLAQQAECSQYSE